MPNLRILDLGYNQLSGKIPQHPCNGNCLEQLILNDNFFTGNIPDYSECSYLRTLMIGNNPLSGTIPSKITLLTDLTYLSIRFTNIGGSLPYGLQFMTSLETIILDNNQLEGEIPSQLTSIPNLKNLKLQNNKFTGKIPSSFSDMTNLEYIYYLIINLFLENLMFQITNWKEISLTL